MRNINLFVCLWASLAIMSSCSEDENFSDQAKVQLAISSSADAAPSTSGGRVAGNLNITLAMVGIEKIEIKADNGTAEEDATEYDFTGPYVLDLLTGTSTPELPIASIEPGVYNKAEAELSPVIGDTASVVIEGTYQGTPFTFIWKNTEDFKAESDQGFELTSESLNNLLINIDLQALFNSVDFGVAEPNQDGEIILSADSNRDLADIIESNIEQLSEIGLDQDEDGKVD